MLKFLALFSLLAATLVPAQTSGSKGGPKVRFLAERAPEAIGKVMLVAKEAKSAQFDLPTNHLSEPQTPPERIFSVWSAARNVSVATVTLPEQGDSFIVLLVPSADGGYKPIVISAKDANFKPGDIYFYNHADKTVLGYVGTSKFILEPAKGKTVRPQGPSGDEKNYYEVGLGIREKEGDRTLSTARWPVQKDMRMYVFFYLNPKSQRLDFRAVDEFVDPEIPQR
jgi:hypothetical protein